MPDHRYRSISQTWFLVIVGVLPLSLTHCGNAPGNQAQTIKWLGTDSAGANIELTMLNGVPQSATVTDVVLGSALAEFSSSANQDIAFKVVFPGGVRIEYTGRWGRARSESTAITGNWIQKASGLFGPDFGTWSVRIAAHP